MTWAIVSPEQAHRVNPRSPVQIQFLNVVLERGITVNVTVILERREAPSPHCCESINIALARAECKVEDEWLIGKIVTIMHLKVG